MKKIIIVSILCLILFSCDLNKSNPLDVTDIPQTPTNIGAISSPENSEEKYVNIDWYLTEPLPYGVYVYRSMSYDGKYTCIDTVQVSESHGYSEDEDVYQGYLYFYRLSCFNEEGLEGYLSGFVSVKVK